MTLLDRLRALGKRRELDGIYTDQNICEAAIEEIERLRAERLRKEVKLWKDRFEAERADHEATIKHANKALNEATS